MARFYVEGHEVDIQEPFFHVEEQIYEELCETIVGLLHDYV